MCKQDEERGGIREYEESVRNKRVHSYLRE